MYKDDDPWPFKCPACGEEFAKKIGWLKTQTSVKCPGHTNPGPVPCPVTIQVRPEEFFLALTKARRGEYDIWRHTWIRKPRPG
jgi:hypothetical protein